LAHAPLRAPARRGLKSVGGFFAELEVNAKPSLSQKVAGV